MTDVASGFVGRVINELDDPAIINKKEIRVVGIPRSGQHAIIQWIIHQAKAERYVYLNACQEDCFRDPYNNMDINSIITAERWQKKDLLIYNFEMKDLPKVFNDIYEQVHDITVGHSAQRVDILILRDPYNNFASFYKWAKANNWVSQEWIDDYSNKWKQYAREYIKKTHYLKYNTLCINFNSWFKNLLYRKSVIERIGYDFDEQGIINVIARAGIAHFAEHTFDGVEFEGRAQDMRILERWKYYVSDPVFLSAFDDEIRDLSQGIFGPICDL